MNKKRIFVFLAIVLLVALVYLQLRAWRRFDWSRFSEGAIGLNYLQVLYGVVLIHVADLLRAVRWKIFLRPSQPKASWKGLISPQYVGFTGLALLGRPGEFIRPYLIARKEGVSFPSQLAIWFVERAFDIGAVTVIFCADVFLIPSMRDDYPGWRNFGFALLALFLGFAAAQWALWRHGKPISQWVGGRVSRFAPDTGAHLEKKLLAVSEGMNAIHDVVSFVELCLLSLSIWLLVALAYRTVTHAYPASTGLPDLNLPECILLMGASVAGGVIQLPVVGGGSQLATIAALNSPRGFNFSPELAVSCGILLWLVTFISIVPLGLVLSHREHLSLRKLSVESEAEAKAT